MLRTVIFNMKGLENAIRCKVKKRKNVSRERQTLFSGDMLIYLEKELIGKTSKIYFVKWGQFKINI